MSWGGEEEGEAKYAQEALLYVSIIKIGVRHLIPCGECSMASQYQEKVGDKR